MDYQKLFQELPKAPIKWNVKDIEIWLSFIGLKSLYQRFSELSIDGSCLNSLTEEDLKDELKIKSGITIKKMMSWINTGLRQYSEYVTITLGTSSLPTSFIPESTLQPEKMPAMINLNNRKISNEEMMEEEITHARPLPINRVEEQMERMNASPMAEEGDQEKKKQFQLIIQQYDGPQSSFFSVKEGGAKIGRHSSNAILILDESISRFHAEIQFQEGKFYLKDSGSTTGTFIKVIQKVEVFEGMILEMGSNQFQVQFIPNGMQLEVIEGPNQSAKYQVILEQKASIGRKLTNRLNFTDDQHLSNIHASFFRIGSKIYIEDMGTTNGTWQRLSFEGEASNSFEVENKTVFKIGSNQTYTCKIKTSYVSQKANQFGCIICYEVEKDCVYMPCRHNAACIRCSKNLKQCPICRNKIEDYVRIYKD